MSTRRTLADLLELERASFREEAERFCHAHGLDTDRLGTAVADLPDVTDGPDIDDFHALSDYERELVRRLWILDDAPLGLTVAGPVYQDNPIRYANQTFRDLTGYSLSDIQGENLRLLQGEKTDADAVDSLREALDIWEPVTVDLWNYRADGTPFRNRVTLRPHSDETGTITNWVGLQARVDE